jgi:DNA-binding HxlR family transcriptional regulator
VPATVRPQLPTRVERAIDVFGNRVRFATLRSLLQDGPATATELAARLDLSRSLLQSHLARLEELGVVVKQQPPARSDHRHRVYKAQASSIDSLASALVGSLRRRL